MGKLESLLQSVDHVILCESGDERAKGVDLERIGLLNPKMKSFTNVLSLGGTDFEGAEVAFCLYMYPHNHSDASQGEGNDNTFRGSMKIPRYLSVKQQGAGI